jgi:hypothetical protein
MNEGMDTLSDKVEPAHLPLIVEELEVNHPLEKELVGELQLAG